MDTKIIKRNGKRQIQLSYQNQSFYIDFSGTQKELEKHMKELDSMIWKYRKDIISEFNDNLKSQL